MDERAIIERIRELRQEISDIKAANRHEVQRAM